MDALITGFSPRVFDEVRKFFAAHPVFEMTQTQEIALEGPGGEMVRVVKATCKKCGFELAPGDNPMLEEQGAVWPASTVRSVRFTHAWDQTSRSVYCGGQVAFVTEPVFTLGVK